MEPEEPTQASHVILMCQPETTAGSPQQDLPLTISGRAAARSAAQQMYGAGHHPGPLLVSNTVAGRETAAILAEVVHVQPTEVYFSASLQGASTDILEVEIGELAKAYTLVTLVAHNPGVSELVRILARDPTVPTLQSAEWRYLPWPPPY